MTSITPEPVAQILETADLADALESDTFRRFLDFFPLAVIVARIEDGERIVYANRAFEALAGHTADRIEGAAWSVVDGVPSGEGAPLAEALVTGSDRIGTFMLRGPTGDGAMVDAYSNLIESEDGTPVFRLAALVPLVRESSEARDAYELRIREKDTLLREIQHRVKNNLQMITALIRLEARNAGPDGADADFARLAGRVEALQLLYTSLTPDDDTDEIDLGIYLSQIASAVMRAHAVEGIRLDMKVDTYPVSVNVAMPAGLVVNELLTNALKHAFVGRDGGTITLHNLVDGEGCRVVVADDGRGLPPGIDWPQPGKLGALIVRSLRDNAKAKLDVESKDGQGTRVVIRFTRKAAAPVAG